MSAFEYRVVPAPVKGEKTRGVRGADGRFAYAVEQVMNTMAAEGWEYQRSETLPSEERTGLTSSTTTWRNLLVFRRPRSDDASAYEPRLLSAPAPLVLDTPVVEAPANDAARAGDRPATPSSAHPPDPDFVFRTAGAEDGDADVTDAGFDESEAAPPLTDNGVEGTENIAMLPDILRDRARRLRDTKAAE